MNTKNQLYTDLGLTPDANAEEIRKAYRSKVQQAHPDKGGCSEEFMRYQNAYNVLSDAELKANYDATGAVFSKNELEDQIRSELGALLTQTLDFCDPLRTDVVQQMRTCIDDRIRQIRSSIKSLYERNGRLQKFINRLSSKSDDNFLKAVLAQQSQTALSQISDLEKANFMFCKMLDKLDDFHYEVDADPSMHKIDTGTIIASTIKF